LGGSRRSERRFTRSSEVSIRTRCNYARPHFKKQEVIIMKTSRNSPCTCGSGLKYKQCCGQKEGKTSPMLITVALLIGGSIIAGAIFVSSDSNQQPGTGAVAPVAPVAPTAAGAPQPNGVPGSPQPPGPVPEGKVWNVEHGHWHDVTAPGAPAPAGAPGAPQPAATQAQPAFTPGPQPPGPVPAGKVWSTEHGHWHDAPK